MKDRLFDRLDTKQYCGFCALKGTKVKLNDSGCPECLAMKEEIK